MLQLFLLAEKWESIAKEIFMLKEFLEAGRIVGTHGIKGELRVDPWCDSPDFLAQFKTLYTKDGAQALEVISSRVHKNLLLVQLKGIDTIEQGCPEFDLTAVDEEGNVLNNVVHQVTRISDDPRHCPKAAILYRICWAWRYITQMMKPFATAPLQTLSKRVPMMYTKLQTNNKKTI